MTRIKVREVVFDKWNIKQHDVSVEEIIEAGTNLIYHKKTYKGRYLAVGRSGERIISFVIKRKSSVRYYLISARDAAKKERMKAYEKERNK